MKWKIAAISSGSLLVLLLIFLIGAAVSNRIRLFNLDTPAVVTQIQKMNQLVTVKYTIQRVVGIREPKQPLGEESILLMVEGEAIGGIDLTALTPDDVMFAGQNTVFIDLPQAKILNVFIDEKHTQVWDHHVTWWTPWVPYDPDLEHRARLSALDEFRATALNMGILDEAQHNAEAAIRDLLGAVRLNVNFRTHHSS